MVSWLMTLEGIMITYEAVEIAVKHKQYAIIEYLHENGFDIHQNDNNLVRQACSSSNLKMVKFLVRLGADIHACYDEGFRWACLCGKLQIAMWIYETYPDTIINSKFGIMPSAFQLACQGRNIKTATWLYSIGANVRVNSDAPFIYACNHRHNGAIEFLKLVCPDYSTRIDGHRLIYEIRVKDHGYDDDDDD